MSEPESETERHCCAPALNRKLGNSFLEHCERKIRDKLSKISSCIFHGR
jgi:hypothetical protein